MIGNPGEESRDRVTHRKIGACCYFFCCQHGVTVLACWMGNLQAFRHTTLVAWRARCVQRGKPEYGDCASDRYGSGVVLVFRGLVLAESRRVLNGNERRA